MNQQKKEQIVEAIQQYCSTTGTSQARLATKIGNISNSTLSQMTNGKWELIRSEMWQRVAIFLGISDSEWKLVNSRNFSIIKNLCADTQHDNIRMVGIPGYTGAGKTTALTHYAQNNANVYYMLSNVLMNRKDFCAALQKTLGIHSEGRISERMRAIIEEVKTRKNPLIIIDDAGKLQDNVIRMIQILYDETEGHCGIVLAGTEYLRNYIEKMAGKDKLGFRELRSRVKYWLPLTKPSAKIISDLCEANGIKDEAYKRYVVSHSTDFRQANGIITNIKKLLAKGQEDVLDHVTISIN